MTVSMNKPLLQLIDEFAAESGISGHRVTKLAGNTRLYERLLKGKGKRVWPETEIKVRAFIMSQRANPSPRRPHRKSTQQHAQV